MPHSGGVKHLACRLTIESTTSMSQLLKLLKKEQRFIALLHISLRWYDPDQVQWVFSQLSSR